jgi:hypothetical protein
MKAFVGPAGTFIWSAFGVVGKFLAKVVPVTQG